MTPEPKDVQLARRVIEARLTSDAESAGTAYLMAKSIVDAHEANLDTGRKQAEERQRAIDETARRWPELAGKWLHREIHGYREFTNPRGGEVLSNDGSHDSDIYFDGDENGETRPVSVVLALIDAAGRNTTAERLRKAIVDALECIDGGIHTAADIVLKEALEAETWSR